jgi:hypothetical protein
MNGALLFEKLALRQCVRRKSQVCEKDAWLNVDDEQRKLVETARMVCGFGGRSKREGKGRERMRDRETERRREGKRTRQYKRAFSLSLSVSHSFFPVLGLLARQHRTRQTERRQD